MIPFFFGAPPEGEASASSPAPASADECSQPRLYGVYTPPSPDRSHTPCRAGVLLCQPFGREYFSARAVVASLAAKLGARGIPVLRFDFRGTGDSTGVPSFAGFREDARAAEAELRARSGLDDVVYLGLRLGAAVAFLETADRSDIQTMILWDPIVSGRTAIEIGRRQDHQLRRTVPRSPRPAHTDDFEELCGTMVPTGFITELESISLCERKDPVVSAVVLVHSELDPEIDSFNSKLRGQGTALRREYLPSPFRWNGPVLRGAPVVPGKRIEPMLAVLEEELL